MDDLDGLELPPRKPTVNSVRVDPAPLYRRAREARARWEASKKKSRKARLVRSRGRLIRLVLLVFILSFGGAIVVLVIR